MEGNVAAMDVTNNQVSPQINAVDLTNTQANAQMENTFQQAGGHLEHHGREHYEKKHHGHRDPGYYHDRPTRTVVDIVVKTKYKYEFCTKTITVRPKETHHVSNPQFKTDLI
jgi:hypothetical protein